MLAEIASGIPFNAPSLTRPLTTPGDTVGTRRFWSLATSIWTRSGGFPLPRSDARSFRTLCESARANNAWLILGSRTKHRLYLCPGTHSGRPTPGPSLGLGFRPLPSFDHLGFRLAQRRIQTVKSSKELLSI